MGAVFARAREIATLRRFLADSNHRYSVLVVEGEPGIGKTALWRHAIEDVGGGATVLLWCRTAESEARLAFSSLGDLLAPIGDEVLRALPGPQRVALEVALLRTLPHEVPPDPRAVAVGVLSALDRLADDAPVLVAIDDVQWLDPSSAAALQFALRRLDPGRALGVLATARTEHAGVPGRFDFSLLPTLVERVRLGPLDLAALSRMIRVELDLVLPRPTMVRIEKESGGNPLFALELARALHESGSPTAVGERLPVPAGLTRLLRARMESLPAGARQALLVAALASEPTTELIERVLGPSSGEDLERAWHAGVIELDDERIRFAHPLYASTVASSVPPHRRRPIHRRLASVVDDPEAKARHLALATVEPDEAVASILDHGSSLARSRAAWAEAAALLERARELTPRGQLADTYRRGISSAEYHVHAGDRGRGRTLIEELLDEPLPSDLRADALRLLAEITLHDENYREADRLYEQALEHTADPRLAAIIELGRTYVHLALMDLPAGTAHARRALARAESIADLPLVGQALSHCAMLDFLRGEGVHWPTVERALELEVQDAFVPMSRRPSVLAAALRMYVGHHDEARRQFMTLRQDAQVCGDESDLAFVTIWLSWLETRCGDLAAAADLADEAASLASLTGSPSMHAWALTQRAFVLAHLGDATETRKCCAEASDAVQRSANLLPHIWIVAALGLLELSLGNADAAWQAYRPMVELLEQQGIAEPVQSFFLPDAIESLITTGQLDRADRLLTVFEHRGRELDRVWALATGARCRGLHLAASGNLADALITLDGALVEHERIDLGVERARTLLTRGIIERRAGKRSRATQSILQARQDFERMGARLWADRAALELSRLGGRGGTPADVLTATERKVAELVAEGRTNREAARRLFVTEKTIEAHLTRIYRKLGVRSRAQLIARIGSDPTNRGARGPEM